MPHLDADRLILRALGEEPLTADESGHLDSCPACRAELAAFGHVADEGRATQNLLDLPLPPDRVWARVQAGLALDVVQEPAVVRLPARRRGPGWAMTAALAAAAAVLAVVGTLFLTDRPSSPCSGTTEVRLSALPGTPSGVSGYACLRVADGQRRLHIHAEGMPAQPDGDYEAWLLDASSLGGPSLRMEALGVLTGGGDEDLPVPANLDLVRYRIIDISAEPHDGNAAHSGNSLLRGTLS